MVCTEPVRHQAISWTNAGLLLIGTLWTTIGDTLIETSENWCELVYMGELL